MIHHVAIEVREDDVATCVRFWALLGFAHVEAPAGLRARATWLQARGTQIHLLHAERPHVPPEGHVAVVAADYDTTLQTLREAGFQPQAHTQHWGSPRSFVRCPAGHRIEVMAFAPE